MMFLHFSFNRTTFLIIGCCYCWMFLSTGRAFSVSKVTSSNQHDGAKRTISQQQPQEIFHSSILGDLRRIRMPGQDDESFLANMGVPTFACCSNVGSSYSLMDPSDCNNKKKPRGLEGVLGNHGPAFVLDRVLSKRACNDLIDDCETIGFGNFDSGKNHHGALQILVSLETAHAVGQAIGKLVNLDEVLARHIELLQQQQPPQEQNDVRLVFAGINRRWRVYRYDASGNETFAPHTDCGFPPSGLSEDGTELVWDDSGDKDIISRLTILMYLNDDFVGGETKFYQPQCYTPEGDPLSLVASIKPIAGSCLIFPQVVGEDAVDYANEHWPLHEGSPVTSGSRPKYVIRSDVLFCTETESMDSKNDILFRYDDAVRNTFLPKSSPAVNPTFASHLASLYNPHMGVENMGYLLYSFIRFTKKRKIVEIGAGYTSLWILQALQDNDEELARVRQLQRDGKNRLLDIEWTIHDVVEAFDQEPAKLLCIDNCKHQKETATGASAVARSLGLDSYMEFVKADAFELDLENESVDILWCDFGVGARMKEFVSAAWPCLRPGGFLLCHSTLTNSNTRKWLDAARAHKDQDETGIPPDDYVELSLLEPHKFFQNSVSILQKRKSEKDTYEEPIYSQYA